jgi:LPXTG-motif cell wall-anchored protein
MNRVAQKGLVTAMVAGGLLAAGAGYARADSAARGDAAGSPGVLSGNSVEVPVHVPVNVCGNTVNVIGLLNPAMGNACANKAAPARPCPHARPGRHAGPPADEHTGSAPGRSRPASGTHAAGGTRGSAGALSGNSVRVPVHLPVDITGNSVNVAGIGNAVFGNTAANGGSAPARGTHPAPTPAPPAPPAHDPVPAPPNVSDAAAPALAHTGTDGLPYTAGGGAALLLGGAVLYRRFRPGRA